MRKELDEKKDIGHASSQEAAKAEAAGMLNELEGLKQRNPAVYNGIMEQLQAPGSHMVELLAPHRITRSRWANRHEDSFKGAEFQELKEAIAARGGNTQPIIVRALTPADPRMQPMAGNHEPPQYEIVAGHRRHQACRELGLPVRALVIRKMSDLEMSQAMFDENNARSGLTPWEAGSMYQLWLDAGLYPSANQLALRLGKSLSDVTRALNLRRLPDAVIAAFASPIQLQYKDFDVLSKLLKENGRALLERAQQLAEEYPRRPRAEVLRLLQEAVHPDRVGSTNTTKKSSLKYQNLAVGELFWQSDGSARMSVATAIPQASQARFEADVSAAIARALRVQKPHNNPKQEPQKPPQ